MEELLKDLREVCEKHKMGIKCGQSPIEVKRVNYRHRISDDTHDKVYGLNKQMCDIDKHLSEAGYFGMICEGQVEARKKLKVMKEKKTKKMTKAEAFEYLKGKKIKCICAVAHEDAQANKVEKFLKDVGCKYHFANHISWCDWYWPLYGFIVDKKGEIYVAFENQKDFFEQDFSELISADDILSIEIVDEKKKSEEEEALDKISCLGAQIVDILLRMKGHHHVTITETTVALHDEGMSLFHSDPF